MSERDDLVRGLWTLFEPLHAVTYFSPEARDAFAAIGLTRYWDGYFAGRSAPLGRVEAAGVGAAFAGFAPALVGRSLPSAWETASVQAVLDARSAGAAATLRRLLPDEQAVALASVALTRAAVEADTVGRPLAAANQALPAETDPYRALWLATATLREHRGDGHVIALVTEGIAGLGSILLRSGLDLNAQNMQRARGWNDDQWATGRESLRDRGLLTPEFRVTPDGALALARVEELTNRLALGPWQAVPDARLIEIASQLAPLAGAVSGLYPRPNPIGMPEPWNPVLDPDALGTRFAPTPTPTSTPTTTSTPRP